MIVEVLYSICLNTHIFLKIFIFIIIWILGFLDDVLSSLYLFLMSPIYRVDQGLLPFKLIKLLHHFLSSYSFAFKGLLYIFIHNFTIIASLQFRGSFMNKSRLNSRSTTLAETITAVNSLSPPFLHIPSSFRNYPGPNKPT